MSGKEYRHGVCNGWVEATNLFIEMVHLIQGASVQQAEGIIGAYLKRFTATCEQKRNEYKDEGKISNPTQ